MKKELSANFGRNPCEEDYLQFIETGSDRVVYTLCAGMAMPADPMVFKGPVGLKFVTDKSYLWTLDDSKEKKAMKRNRGFQFAYSINS